MPQFFNPDIKEYLTLNGFKDITETPDTLVFIRNNEAVVFSNMTIRYKRNTCNWATNMMAVANSWQTLKRYFGFDGQDMFTVTMLLHLMGVVRIQDVNRKAKNEMATIFHNQLLQNA